MHDERIVYNNGSYMHERYSTTYDTLRKGGGYTVLIQGALSYPLSDLS